MNFAAIHKSAITARQISPLVSKRDLRRLPLPPSSLSPLSSDIITDTNRDAEPKTLSPHFFPKAAQRFAHDPAATLLLQRADVARAHLLPMLKVADEALTAQQLELLRRAAIKKPMLMPIVSAYIAMQRFARRVSLPPHIVDAHREYSNLLKHETDLPASSDLSRELHESKEMLRRANRAFHDCSDTEFVSNLVLLLAVSSKMTELPKLSGNAEQFEERRKFAQKHLLQELAMLRNGLADKTLTLDKTPQRV